MASVAAGATIRTVTLSRPLAAPMLRTPALSISSSAPFCKVLAASLGSRLAPAAGMPTNCGGKFSETTSRAGAQGDCQAPGCFQATKRLQSTEVSPQPQLGTCSAPLSGVRNSTASGCVEVTWRDGRTGSFPHVWLRDCCLCAQCHHADSRMRVFSMADLHVGIAPAHVHNDEAAQELVVIWPDGHQSRYGHEWLAERALSNAQLRKQQHHTLKSVLWDGETGQRNLLRVDYEQLMTQLPTLQLVLRQLQTFGVLVVTSCPLRFGVVEELANRVGHLRLTHYGKTFRVANKIKANNLAFTAGDLPFHLDLPYYHYIPGVQLLHCISQHVGTGGDNLLADSFHVAELIRRQRPDLFRLLSTVPLEFCDIGEENESFDSCRFHKVQEHPMFKLDNDGSVEQVCFHNFSRSYRLWDSAETVKQLYEAMKLFYDLCMHQDNHMLYKMNDGDVLVFNNKRIMHGRKGYSVTATSERTLEGGYTDWDEVLCRYRVVNAMLEQPPAV